MCKFIQKIFLFLYFFLKLYICIEISTGLKLCLSKIVPNAKFDYYNFQVHMYVQRYCVGFNNF